MYTEILAPTSNNNYHKDPDPSDLSRSSTVNYKIEIVHLASCHLSHSPFDILDSSLSLSLSRSREFLERQKVEKKERLEYRPIISWHIE